MKYFIKDNFLSNDKFLNIKNIFDTEEIIKYCSNTEVAEHEASKKGNYSFPVELFQKSDDFIFSIFNDDFFLKQTERLLGRTHQHHFSYANFHYDLTNTCLGIHNDLKDYRWLITSQLYIEGDENDGVILFDQHTNQEIPIKLRPNTFYSLLAEPYSWHYVNTLKQNKKSLLIRWGQKKIFTIVNKDENLKTAILILGDLQYNDDDLKIGSRMQNLTEAWLINQGYKNIFNSPWKNVDLFYKLMNYLLKNYDKICIVPAGYAGSGNLFEKSCVLFVNNIVDYNEVKKSLDVNSNEVIRIYKSNFKLAKQTVFGNNRLEMVAKLEKILYNTDIMAHSKPINPKEF